MSSVCLAPWQSVMSYIQLCHQCVWLRGRVWCLIIIQLSHQCVWLRGRVWCLIIIQLCHQCVWLRGRVWCLIIIQLCHQCVWLRGRVWCRLQIWKKNLTMMVTRSFVYKYKNHAVGSIHYLAVRQMCLPGTPCNTLPCSAPDVPAWYGMQYITLQYARCACLVRHAIHLVDMKCSDVQLTSVGSIWLHHLQCVVLYIDFCHLFFMWQTHVFWNSLLRKV